MPVAVEQAHRADGPGLDDERQIGGRGDVQVGDVRPQDRVALGELLRRFDEAGAEGPHGLAHRVGLVDPGDAGAGHEAVRGPFGDQADAPGLDQAHDQAGGAQVNEAVGVLQDVDDVLDGAGVGEGGRGEFDDAGLLPAGLVPGGLVEAGLALAEFPGGVPDDADDAAGPSGVVAPDVALGVGPAQGAVAAAHAEVGAVVLAAVLQCLGDRGVQAPRLAGRDPLGERLGAVVVLVEAHVEDVVGLGVHLHQAGVKIPVETAHPVEREDRVRVGGPVVRE